MIKISRKAQSSVEFLTTYGWAIILLLAAIAVLMNYGFLSPSKYMPERAELGDQIFIEEYFLDTNYDASSGDSVLSLKIRNNFPRTIVVTHLGCDGPNGNTYSLLNKPEINSGETEFIACHDFGDLSTVKKNKIEIAVQFNRYGGANNHTIKGSVLAQANDGEYSTLIDPDSTNNICSNDNNDYTCP